MKPTPKGWQRITPAVFYDDASSAIEWLCKVFGFSIQLKIEGGDGDIAHSELSYGDGLVMVGSTKKAERRKSPRSLDGANTQSLMMFVDDADAHCAHSRRAGAKILTLPKTEDYGPEYWTDRSYEAEDCEGHRWWFTERLGRKEG